jgi:hypothetical protein
MKLDIANALKEMTTMTENEVETQAAASWAARAAACYELASRQDNLGDKFKWILRAKDQQHEALEHAALTEDGGKLVADVQRTLNAYIKKI